MPFKNKISLLLLSIFLLTGASTSKAPTVATIAVPTGLSKLPPHIQYSQLIADALHDVGIKVTYEENPLKRSYELMTLGDLDGVISDDKSQTEKRDKILTTSFPVLMARCRIFYRSGENISLANLGKFKGAFRLNFQIIENEARRLKLNYIMTDSVERNLQLLTSKRVDYILMDEALGGTAFKELILKDKIKMSHDVFINMPIYFSMNSKYKEKWSQIEAALKARMQKPSLYPIIKTFLYKFD